MTRRQTPGDPTTDRAARPPEELNGVHRVRKAYEQVYDQLRDMILSGGIAQGHRLPNETKLAARFGVSRGTVREALRLLVAENLVRTAKGAAGGSFVTLPTVDHVSEFLERNIELLSHTEELTLPEFLETRELIEVFAVRQAAKRRTAAHIDALRATLLPPDSDLSAEAQYLHNKEFHAVLVDACGNALLKISALPIFFVLHAYLARSALPENWPREVCDEHQAILQAIEAGDADLAETRMREHLSGLALVYGRIWRPSRGTST